MPKWTGVVVGALEIAAGVVLSAIPGGAAAAPYLISAGIGTAMGGIGTMLAKGPLQGVTGTAANPIEPWNVIYGQAHVPGNRIYTNQFGENDKWLDMVIVVASHPCNNIDQLLVDGNYVPIDPTTRCSFTRLSHDFAWNSSDHPTYSSEFKRQSGVVTVTLGVNVTNVLQIATGDRVNIHSMPANSPDAQTLQGIYRITVTGANTFVYFSPGNDADVVNAGHITTIFFDYKSKIYMENMLGDQTLGQTFNGMINGTPYDGDMGNLIQNNVTSDNPLGNPWTVNCSCVGHTVTFIRLHYNDQIWANGIPQLSFVVSGKKDIYDPRTGTNGYTTNAALCIADYLANSGTSQNDSGYGYKLQYGTDIPTTPLIAAANHCDEPVNLAAGGTEPRYTINGNFKLTEKRGDVLSNLLTACAGRFTDSGGQYIIYPGVWQGTVGTSNMDLEQVAVAPVKYIAQVKSRDLFNSVKGTYISPVNNFQSSDFPPYMQDGMHGYTTNPPGAGGNYDGLWYADGSERRYLDLQFPFTNSCPMAQRLAKIELLRRRYQGTGTFAMNMTGYPIIAWDVWPFTFTPLSWNQKEFEILKARLNIVRADQGGAALALTVEVDVQETDASIFDWSPAEELTPQGYKQPTLPSNLNPDEPTNIQVLSDNTTDLMQSDGILKSRILVTWTDPPDGFFVNGGHIEVEWQLMASPPAPWSNTQSVLPGVQRVFIDGVEDGQQYNIQLRTVNAAGIPSDWVSATGAGPVTVNSVTAIPYGPNGGTQQPVYQDAVYPLAMFGVTPTSETASDGSVIAGVDVSPAVPVNVFSSLIPAPILDPTITYGTGGSIPAGYFVLALVAEDTASPPGWTQLSNPLNVTVPAGMSTVTLTLNNYSAGVAQYLVFTGISQNALYFRVSNSASASITLTSLASVDGSSSGPPDPNFDHFAIGTTKVLLLGSFGGTAATAPVTIVKATPLAGSNWQIQLSNAAFTANQWVGRILSWIVQGTGNPTPLQNYTITANDATTVTVHAPSNPNWPAPQILVGDQVIILLQASSADWASSGGTKVTDAQLAMTADQYAGKVLRVFYPDGSNETSFITTNTPQSCTVNAANPFNGPLPVFWWIEESSFSAMFPQTAAAVSAYQSNSGELFAPIDNITGYYAVQLFSVSANGMQSIADYSPIRAFWWPGAAGGGGSGDYIIAS